MQRQMAPYSLRGCLAAVLLLQQCCRPAVDATPAKSHACLPVVDAATVMQANPNHVALLTPVAVRCAVLLVCCAFLNSHQEGHTQEGTRREEGRPQEGSCCQGINILW